MAFFFEILTPTRGLSHYPGLPATRRIGPVASHCWSCICRASYTLRSAELSPRSSEESPPDVAPPRPRSRPWTEPELLSEAVPPPLLLAQPARPAIASNAIAAAAAFNMAPWVIITCFIFPPSFRARQALSVSESERASGITSGRSPNRMVDNERSSPAAGLP